MSMSISLHRRDIQKHLLLLVAAEAAFWGLLSKLMNADDSS